MTDTPPGAFDMKRALYGGDDQSIFTRTFLDKPHRCPRCHAVDNTGTELPAPDNCRQGMPSGRMPHEMVRNQIRRTNAVQRPALRTIRPVAATGIPGQLRHSEGCDSS